MSSHQSSDLWLSDEVSGIIKFYLLSAKPHMALLCLYVYLAGQI